MDQHEVNLTQSGQLSDLNLGMGLLVSDAGIHSGELGMSDSQAGTALHMHRVQTQAVELDAMRSASSGAVGKVTSAPLRHTHDDHLTESMGKTKGSISNSSAGGISSALKAASCNKLSPPPRARVEFCSKECMWSFSMRMSDNT